MHNTWFLFWRLLFDFSIRSLTWILITMIRQIRVLVFQNSHLKLEFLGVLQERPDRNRQTFWFGFFPTRHEQIFGSDVWSCLTMDCCKLFLKLPLKVWWFLEREECNFTMKHFFTLYKKTQAKYTYRTFLTILLLASLPKIKKNYMYFR